jgi:hypothetical protein
MANARADSTHSRGRSQGGEPWPPGALPAGGRLCFNAAVFRRPAPGLLTALCVLLCFSGGLTLFYAVLGYGVSEGVLTNALPVWGQGLFGACLVGIALALRLGQRWAWRLLVIVCIISLLLGALLVGLLGLRAVVQVAGPAVYLVLLTRPSVRCWFSPQLTQADPA